MAELGVFGVGVATADPELRTVGEKNTSVCTVNLAFNRSYQNKAGKWEKEPCFLRAQVWGARANRMADLVKKGQPIYVCGYMKQDSWNDKDSGQKKVSYSITLRDFQLCEKVTKKTNESQPANVTTPSSVDDSDIPF